MTDPIEYWEWFSVEKKDGEHFILDDEPDLLLNKLEERYPNTYPNISYRDKYLLRDEIKFGYTEQSLEAKGDAQAVVNVNLNNSPPAFVYLGGRRRTRKQYFIMEMTFIHTGNTSDLLTARPKTFNGTKKKLENIFSTNPRILKPEGITMIKQPTVLQDGKSFGNFGILNNFQAPMNIEQDDSKWRYVLLYMMEIDEILL